MPADPVGGAANAKLSRGPVIARGWTLRRRLGGAFGAMAALGVLIVAAVVFSTVFFVRAANSVIYRWQPATVSSERVLSDLVEQESELRGYVLGSDPAFLQLYDNAVTAQRREIVHLGTLLDGDAQLHDRLKQLDSAVQAWQRSVAEPAIAARRGGQDRSSQEIVSARPASSDFARIREAATALQGDVADRTASARSDRSVAGTVFITALSITLVVLAAAAFGLWRGLHRWVLAPVDRLGAQSRTVASGDIGHSIVADGPRELTELGRDVEAMRLRIAEELGRAESAMEQLVEQGRELERSNEDLQQFAYVASHDLSEPLRKVANFCQLLERQYSPQLDDRARQYIGFAVDGAKRMQALITDLLALSRVGRTTEDFETVDLDAALDHALRTLEDRIADAGGRVERLTPLPSVRGDRALLTSLLENLVGNAIKYRREDAAPVVRIGVQQDPDGVTWQFAVADNGIGIDQEYAERIFAVFQRLHLRDQYGGTGIGLALCRRIVDFHGGAIWLAEDVESGSGATFRFTLPVAGDPEDHHDEHHRPARAD